MPFRTPHLPAQVPVLIREVALPHTPRWFRLKTRVFLFILGAFLVLGFLLATIASLTIQGGIQRSFSERALRESTLVAALPEVRAALSDDNAQQTNLNSVIEPYRLFLGADYVVVTDKATRRLTHPTPGQIGKQMVGGDFSSFLQGKSIIETVDGTLGRSVRGKVPVKRGDGQIIGLASVGFLLPRLQDVFWQVVHTAFPWYLGSLALSLLLADALSRRVQREMLNLEPEQIASGLLHYRTMLNTLDEGVLVARNGEVHVLNPQARNLLSLPSDELPMPLPAALHDLKSEPTPLEIAGRPLLGQVRATEDGSQVYTLRDLAQVKALAEELTQSKRYADLLRAQTHEFTNRLHTIAGLLHLNESGRALELIYSQAARQSEHLEASTKLRHLNLVALLLGKYERAGELGVHLQLDPHSSLPPQLPKPVLDLLELALGNLVENACEASSGTPKAEVRVLLGTDPEGVVLEVRDNGPGIPQTLNIMERGVSSKGEGRGMGLSLVQSRAQMLQATLTHDRVRDGDGRQWTRFTLDIPLPEDR